MSIKHHFGIRSSVLKDRVNKYALLGIGIAVSSIVIASILASYQQTGLIDFHGIILAQKTNPALWALDLTLFIFAYWGQSFYYDLVDTMETLFADRTRDLLNKSSDLESKLHYETNHDHLTNLPNQRLLLQRISQGIQNIHKGEELAVIVLHIHSFKEINLKYGSFSANSVLIQFAEKLKSVLLDSQLLQAGMGMNMAARLQGAEFAFLIPRLKKEHKLDAILDKIISETSANFMIDGMPILTTTAAGIATYPEDGHDNMSLLQNASSALFYAEREGWSHATYNSSMNNETGKDPIKIKELSDLIINEKINLWYEPHFDLKTQTIVGVDALLYLEEDEDKVLSIEKLLTLIEASDIVKKLGYLMIKAAIDQLAIWHEANCPLYAMVPLLDPTDTELPDTVESLLITKNVSPKDLKLALTEKACLNDQTKSMSVLKRLADLGVKIVIVDCCSGYTSFSYLTNFPISEVKIDKSFIINLSNDEKKLHIVEAIISIAKILNLVVIADGIPDEQCVKKLNILRCLYGQGSYFSAAVNSENIQQYCLGIINEL